MEEIEELLAKVRKPEYQEALKRVASRLDENEDPAAVMDFLNLVT